MKVALRGRVVTMNDAFDVLDDAVVYGDEKGIAAVLPRTAPPPAAWSAVPVVPTGGTIYPGMIELHNHLPYNVLELGKFTKKYGNRDEWRTGNYRNLVTGPLEVLNRDPKLVASIVRFVECKNVVAGVTSSQGITLAKNAKVQSLFGGLTRNVEETKDKSLPDANTHVADLEAGGATKFLSQLEKAKSAMLFHLAEGTDDKTQKVWERLRIADGKWAITDRLAGIHGVRLGDADWKIYGEHGGTAVWSPTSNLLLYGDTAKVDRAIARGVTLSLGADWSYSGGKNLLAELKVARAVAADRGWGIADRALVAMATRNPARALHWAKLGSLEAGKYLDAVVVRGTADDPYAQLIDASEKDILLTMIGAVAQFATPGLMTKLGDGSVTEGLKVGGLDRKIVVSDPTMDASVSAVPLSVAVAALAKAMRDLPALAAQKAAPRARPHAQIVFDDDLAPIVPAGTRAATPLELSPMTLDALTVVDQAGYWDRLRSAGSLPASIGARLPT